MTARSGSAARHLLFLCTGNSARSIGGEAIVNALGGGRIVAHSAGSQPTGFVHPLALQVLAERGFATADLRSKSWHELAGEGAPELAIVITVCDAAAGESCPIWPGHPVCVHWGLPDPAACSGSESEQLALFGSVYDELERRVRALLALPLAELDSARLRAELVRIGSNPEAR